MGKSKDLLVAFAICLFILVPLTLLIKVDAENSRNRYVEDITVVEENSIGCKKLVGGGRKMWVCPDEFNIQTVEHKVCRQSGSTTRCRIEERLVALKDLD